MKRKVFLLSLFLIMGIAGTWAQQQYTLRVVDASGTPYTGNSYLGTQNSLSDTEWGNRSAVLQSAPSSQGSNEDLRRVWYLEPVGGSEVGWYYIRNYLTHFGLSVKFWNQGPGGDGSVALYNLNAADGGVLGRNRNEMKWRLVKVTIPGVEGEDNMYFKLVSKSGGKMVVGNAAGSVSNTTTYNTDRTIFLLENYNSNDIVKNSDQEIVSNDIPVNPSATDNSNPVYTYGLTNLPAPAQDNAWNRTGGDVNALLTAADAGYRLAPICYTGSPTTTLRYGAYASGDTEGDGYYFTRLSNYLTEEGSKPDEFHQNLNPFTLSDNRDDGQVILISAWVRGIIDDNYGIDNLEQAYEEGPEGEEKQPIEGYRVAGKISFNYDDEDNTPGEVDLVIPEWAITTTSFPNDPNAWFFFTHIIDYDTHKGHSITRIQIENNIEPKDVGEGSYPPTYLDADNLAVEVRSQVPEAIFRYKLSQSTQQARQSVHTLEQVIYTDYGRSLVLSTSSSDYRYYRWYRMTASNYEWYPNRIQPSDLTGSTMQTTLSNGIMFANINKSVATRGNQVNYDLPSQAENNTFFASLDATLYCDLSNYTDFRFTGKHDAAEDFTGEIDEPTLSIRNVFHIRYAGEIANEIDEAITAQKTYEYYEVEAPIGSSLRIAPQYAYTNYWINIDATPTQCDRFFWAKIDPGTNERYTAGTGASVNNASAGYYFPQITTYRYLEIDTQEKENDEVEYYAVDAGQNGSTDANRRRIAVFKVTYKEMPAISDPFEEDIFSDVSLKELVVAETFDQTASAPNPLPSDPFYNRDEFSIYGMGVKMLPIKSSTYGFVNSLYFDGDEDGKIIGGGDHPNIPSGFNSEYSFPQTINNILTSPTVDGQDADGNDIVSFTYGWNTDADVSDITALRKEGVGNMLYVNTSGLQGLLYTTQFEADLCANSSLYTSAWLVNLNANSTSDTNPNLIFKLTATNPVTKEEIVLNHFYTGSIAYTGGTWVQIGFETLMPNEVSGLDMTYRLDVLNNGFGNDYGITFAMDDIRIYQTTPAIAVSRTTDFFCMPKDDGEVTDNLGIEIGIDLDQLGFQGPAWTGNFYYRFLYPDIANGGTRTAFPGQYQDDEETKDMYIGMAGSESSYYYGSIDLSGFVWSATNNRYESGDVYIYQEEGRWLLAFTQTIPSSVLNGSTKGVYNNGAYYMYTAITPDGLGEPDCLLTAKFDIEFDGTSFELSMGSRVIEDMSEFNLCTNNTLTVTAFETDPGDAEKRLFAYYDWYYGPIDTQPEEALDYKYDLMGNYEVGGTPPAERVIFSNYTQVPIRDRDGFDVWLKTPDGVAWHHEGDGVDWTWGEPNYIGFNQHGGYFRHIIPEISIAGEVVYDIETLDAVTSATRIAPTDNKDTFTETDGWKPVSFRTLKQDLEAYRFFYPYEPTLPSANQTKFPINPHLEAIKMINYSTGEFYLDIAEDTPAMDKNSGTHDGLRFTASSYDEMMVDYWGDETTEYYITRNIPVSPSYSSACDETTEYYITRNIESDSEQDITSIDDLNMLLARMRYWELNGFVELYTTEANPMVETTANVYVTAIPIGIAFDAETYSEPEEPIETGDESIIEICTTMTPLTLKAEEWAPDTWYGEVNSDGNPAMPYFEISDMDEYSFTYTVRLPEKAADGTRPTSQFVVPMLYFDEVRNARVKLMGVIDETGKSVFSEIQTLSTAATVEESYIGLIDPDCPNQLLREVLVPFTHKYNVVKDESVELIDDTDQPYTEEVDIRWKLVDNRGDFMALESYPLVHNSYNYFFEDPADNDLGKEGDPLEIGVEIGDFTVENNKIALEIMANDRSLVGYTRTIEEPEVFAVEDDEEEEGSLASEEIRHFIPGYTYLFALEATGADSWSMSTDCDKVLYFQLKVVPEVVIWGGNSGDVFNMPDKKNEWNLDNNWYLSTTDDEGNVVKYNTFPPLPETKVIIPAGLDQYPVLEEYENLAEKLAAGRADSIPTGYDTSKKIITFEKVAIEFEPEVYEQKSFYSLTSTPFIEFDYNYVPNSVGTIHFNHGGVNAAGAELGRQDLLNYTAAEIDLTINTMQWYGLSAPLRDMYSGDYAFPNINPLVDMRLHNVENPQTEDVFSSWTNSFSTPTVSLTPGLGFSVYVGSKYLTDPIDPNDLDKGYNTSPSTYPTEQTISFPKENTQFKSYDRQTKKFSGTVQSLDSDGRKYSGRFIYETGDNEVNSSLFELDFDSGGEISGEGQAIVVGNPFMAHVNFAEFYRINKDVIAPQYKLLIGTQGKYNAEKYISFSATASDGALSEPISTEEGLTYTSIAPMQSFIVFALGSEGGTIQFTPEMSVVDTNSKLRSSATNARPMLKISAENDKGLSSNALVVLHESASPAYNVMEDSRLMTIKDVVNNIPHVFTIADEMYLDINRMDTLQQILPLGLINGQSGSMRFTVSNALSIPLEAGEELIFRDTEAGEFIPIDTDEFVYTFDYDASDQVGRFFIQRRKAPTSIDTPTDSGIFVFKEGQTIQAVSLNESLTKVEVYDLKGQLLYRQDGLNTNRHTVPVEPRFGNVLILKLSTATSTRVVKVLNK